ncbi:hypothetical protein V3589_02485 [Sinorhizobium fredii]|uniref:hypothetical protein n=1 Tax=Rhizobium fredii TaxID=380 RepID=UPI0030B2F6B0
MPGSVGNPVVLDPFRTIVEVGWRKVPEYIRITVPIESDIVGADEFGTCPLEGTFPYGGELTQTYLVSGEARNRIEEGKPYDLQAIGYWRTSSRTLTVDSGEHPVTISGVPEGPFVNAAVGAWEYAYVGLASGSGSALRIGEVTADEYDDPDFPSLPGELYEATSHDIDLIAHEITASPECGETPGGFLVSPTAPTTGTGANADMDVFFATAATIASGSVNLAGISVGYRGETYSPIAISRETGNDRYLSGDPDFPSGRYAIDVLCKRDSSTA